MSEYSTFLGMKGQHFSPEAVRMLTESRTHSEQSGLFNNTLWTVGPAVAFWAHGVCSTGEHLLGGVKDACFAPTYLFKDETAITVLNIPKHLFVVPYKSLKALTARWADAIFCLVASTAIAVTIVAFAILGFGRGAVAHNFLGTAEFASNDPTDLRGQLEIMRNQLSTAAQASGSERVAWDAEIANLHNQIQQSASAVNNWIQNLEQQVTVAQEQNLQLQQAADPVRQMFTRAGADNIMQLLGNPAGDVATAYRAKVAESPEAAAQLGTAIDNCLQNLQPNSLEHTFLTWLRANYDNTLNWIAANKHEEVHTLRVRVTLLEGTLVQNNLQVPVQ